MKKAIPTTPEARKEWLQDDANRTPITRGGAGSIYYRGDLKDPRELKVIVSSRAKAAGAGLAHFGGLAEDCDTVKGDPLETGINNARREGQEEMAELLGYEPDLDKSRYVHLYTARDDGYFIRSGHGFAVDARLHAYEMDEGLFEALFPKGRTRRLRDENHPGAVETSHAEVMSFFDALKRQDDYWYPHEYFSLWVMAVKVMELDVIALARDVNKEMSPRRVDFADIAARMHTDISTLESYLGPEYAGKLDAYERDFSAPDAAPRPSPKFRR